MRSRLVAFSFYPNNTNTGRERCATRKLRQCHVHLYHSCIYVKRARHPPPSTSQKEQRKPATSICHIHFLSSIIYAKESDILRSKSNHYIKLKNITFSLRRIAVMRSSLVAFYFCLNNTNTRRARYAPNKHYEIPFVRSIPCSSFHNIQLRTPQAT